MPTYDYKCSACKHVFEAFHSMSADPLSECPKCSGTVQRLIGTGAGILFKGSGFYQTDYRKPDYKKAESADKPKESADKPKESTEKKDKKTASKKDAKKAQ